MPETKEEAMELSIGLLVLLVVILGVFLFAERRKTGILRQRLVEAVNSLKREKAASWTIPWLCGERFEGEFSPPNPYSSENLRGMAVSLQRKLEELLFFLARAREAEVNPDAVRQPAEFEISAKVWRDYGMSCETKKMAWRLSGQGWLLIEEASCGECGGVLSDHLTEEEARAALAELDPHQSGGSACPCCGLWTKYHIRWGTY